MAIDIPDANTAFEKVKQAVAALRHDYDQTGKAITKLEADMGALPQMRVPFEDMKQGILDMLDSSARRYAQQVVRGRLSAFATHGLHSIEIDTKERGKPLTLSELEKIVDGEDGQHYRLAQLVSARRDESDDRSLFAVNLDAAHAFIAEVLSTLTPQDFGYNTVNPDKIGPTRAEMRRQLAEWQQQLDALKARRADIRSQLAQLGVNVA